MKQHDIVSNLSAIPSAHRNKRTLSQKNLYVRRFESHLGQGQFGSVQKAKWNCSGGTRDVAVKIMKPSALENAKIKFLQEGAILGQFFHSNVIKLFGLVTMNNPVRLQIQIASLSHEIYVRHIWHIYMG